MTQNTPRPKHPSRKKRIAIAAGVLLAAGAAGSYASANDLGSGAIHFVECFGLMIVDPDTHANNCLPNTVKVEFGSISSPGGPPAPAPVTPVVVPPSYQSTRAAPEA